MVFAKNQCRYKGEWEQCPVLKDFPKHPLFKDLHKGLATNRPSYLSGNGSELQRLVSFPADCAPPLPTDAGYVFASAKDTPLGGRAVILAGQGVFLNGMLIQPDNDNLAFAWNTIQWLAMGPKGPREFALFIDEGKVIDNFALPLKTFGSVPIPPIQVINRMIRGLEEENIINRMLTENVGKEPYLRGLLLLGSLVVLILGAYRIMKNRYRLDSGVPLIVGKNVTTGRAERREPSGDNLT